MINGIQAAVHWLGHYIHTDSYPNWVHILDPVAGPLAVGVSIALYLGLGTVIWKEYQT